MQGDFTVQGKNDFSEELKKIESSEPFELTISNIITHGRSAAIDGTMTTPDGKIYAFYDVYQFSRLKNPKIKEMTSYVLEIKK